MSFASAQRAPLQIRAAIWDVGYPMHFYLSPFDPTIKVDPNGYSPKLPAELLYESSEILVTEYGDRDRDTTFVNGNGLYVREDITTIIWDFGDGSVSKNTGERIGASHVYKKPGNYTVKVKLLDSNKQVIENASLDISVKPGVLRVTYAALPITPEEPSRLSFVAATFQRELAKDEKITYQWDFGDGNTREGENLDQVNHTYATSGKYKTKLTVTNNYKAEGSSRKTISVVAANTAEVTQTDDVLEPPDVILNEVNLQVSGSINGELNAVSIPISRSVFLASGSNDNCRLWINFYDPAQLTHGSILLNLGVLPGETSNYEFTGKQRLDMYFYPNAKQYREKKSTFDPGHSAGNLGGAMHGYGREAGFRMNSGAIKFTLKNRHYLVGTINAGLKGNLSPKKKDDKDLLIGVTGDFTLNLGSRGPVMDAIETGLGCIEQDFYETKRYPQARQKHVQQERPIIRINFSDKIQPASISKESFQVGYPDADGKFVKAAGKFINDKSKIQFVPDQALRRGVRYTIKLKIGEDGVRSASGSFIKDKDGSGWQESEFWTQLPFSNDADSPSNLSCDVYQSVKNVPLISGKPALMKIYADWPKYNDVHASAQYQEFDAQVKLSDSTTKILGDQVHKFTRPDLRKGWSKARLRKDEAAQYPFVPQGNSANVVGHLSVNTYSDNSARTEYFFNCSTPLWDLAPALSVDVFVLNLGDFGYDDVQDESKEIPQQQTAALINRFTREAKKFAEQVFPIKTLTFSKPVFEDRPKPSFFEWSSSCNDNCFNQLIADLEIDSAADFILITVSPEVLNGGSTNKRLATGQGVIVMSIRDSDIYFDKYVFGLVHEFGHAFDLNHTPVVNYNGREKLLLHRGLRATQKYEGIDGMRISPDGTNWWHKSSALGNDESEHVAPLMYPGLLHTKDTFIPRHQYRSIQVFLESLE